jgi:hypothetical protein
MNISSGPFIVSWRKHLQAEIYLCQMQIVVRRHLECRGSLGSTTCTMLSTLYAHTSCVQSSEILARFDLLRRDASSRRWMVRLSSACFSQDIPSSFVYSFEYNGRRQQSSQGRPKYQFHFHCSHDGQKRLEASCYVVFRCVSAGWCWPSCPPFQQLS